ncbi:CASP-LIKE PROTEIN [Salix koriyanagi]|nr:CASP-LIKE PROTEIN [Salix koriyanagi]
MKEMFGGPGKVSGLGLRVGQFVFAAASIVVMVSARGFFNATAFCYLIASMGLQLLWSFGLACLDLHALRSKKNLQNPVLVSLFVVGDWVTSILSLAAACAAAGVTVLFARDLHYCRAPYNFPCSRFQISIALAFISWFLLAISSHVMFWLLAAVSHFSSMPLCPAHRLIAILCCNILVFEVKSLRKTTIEGYVMSFLTSFSLPCKNES